MPAPFVFDIPGGLLRTKELLDCTRRLKETGKPVEVHAFDSVQGLQWNGGRLTFNNQFMKDPSRSRYSDVTVDNIQEAVERVQQINDAGIPFNLTFNSTMESLDVDDEAGNYLLEKLHNGMNGVTVATESLRRHIRANYPKYSLTASICFVHTRADEYLAANQRFEKVVAMPILAYEEETLNLLPKDQLVFILNDRCYLFCVRKDHYDYISRCSLSGNSSPEQQRRNLQGTKCFAAEVPGYRNRVKEPTDQKRNARVSKIVERHMANASEAQSAGFGMGFNITATARRRLFELGIRRFKLQGREFDDQGYQTMVLDFLERIVREELPS